MLFVKDMLFLDGAMAVMAPDVDVLGEIVKVVMYFHVQPRRAHRPGDGPGSRAPSRPSTSPASGPRSAITEPVDHLTYRELQGDAASSSESALEQRQRGDGAADVSDGVSRLGRCYADALDGASDGEVEHSARGRPGPRLAVGLVLGDVLDLLGGRGGTRRATAVTLHAVAGGDIGDADLTGVDVRCRNPRCRR